MQKSYSKENLKEISPVCNCSPIIEMTENIVVFDAEGEGVCQAQISKNGKDWSLFNIGVFKLPCNVKLSDTKVTINLEYIYLRFVTNGEGYFEKCTIAW